MEKLRVDYTHNEAVACITLNDGKGNVLDKVMMGELQTVLDSFKENNGLKLIVFEGEGKHFSFGASVEEHTKENAGQMLKSFHQLFYSILELGVPTAAKISGQCLGGGLELALICNFMYADQTAKLGQPEVVLGVFPPPASLILPLKLGNARADELLITGKSISAERGKEIGLLNEVYETREAMNEAVEEMIGKHILPKSASTLRYATKAGRSFFGHIISKFLPELEKVYVSELMETNDACEGIDAFMEKRTPEWKNS